MPVGALNMNKPPAPKCRGLVRDHCDHHAEDAGFEPARGFIPNTISNRAH